MDSVQAFADEIAERVFLRVMEKLQGQSAKAPRLLTVKQAAEYLGRSPKAIYDMAAKGILPAVREGKRLHFDRCELEEWISQRSQ